MFSKAAAANLRQEFWTSFGKSFPKKWLLYNTKIKGVAFKFVADQKKAMVCLDFENRDEIANQLYYEQLLSLQNILVADYLAEASFEAKYQLENGKAIQRISVTFDEKFSIHDKNTWQKCFEFFYENMSQFELFFYEYEDHIKNI